MPGIEEEIDGAMQQAAQLLRHSCGVVMGMGFSLHVIVMAIQYPTSTGFKTFFAAAIALDHTRDTLYKQKMFLFAIEVRLWIDSRLIKF